jgi:hypothetical protein
MSAVDVLRFLQRKTERLGALAFGALAQRCFHWAGLAPSCPSVRASNLGQVCQDRFPHNVLRSRSVPRRLHTFQLRSLEVLLFQFPSHSGGRISFMKSGDDGFRALVVK